LRWWGYTLDEDGKRECDRKRACEREQYRKRVRKRGGKTKRSGGGRERRKVIARK